MTFLIISVLLFVAYRFIGAIVMKELTKAYVLYSAGVKKDTTFH